ncbi:hypothetical protein [Actinomadura sp. 7K507]|uniref:hypothetical protein n=1 Tax=Actinomadura sp. 7K507 TaxID=2530365 RepID=UPI00105030BA|nr:hypothetical protein [Actinomadura sp. 7K507]TDC85598.1 hypothetical protein E1285_24920 [Actinomadura sp. 7K507]
MNRSAEETTYQAVMETRQWLIIDATIDNEVSTEAEEGDPRDVVHLGNSIRKAGWRQNPGWPRDLKGFESWPAPGQETTMTLNAAQWELVLSALVRWSAVSASLGDAESAADAEQDRVIEALIRRQLAEQGWSAA